MEKDRYKITGTITAMKGKCDFGHKTGDNFILSGYSPGGLCGYFYHDLYPYILMLEFGGKFPAAWSGEVMVFNCMDVDNALTIELRREK